MTVLTEMERPLTRGELVEALTPVHEAMAEIAKFSEALLSGDRTTQIGASMALQRTISQWSATNLDMMQHWLTPAFHEGAPGGLN